VHFARTYAYPETYAPINLLAAVFYLILLCGVPFLHLRKGEKKEAALCVITAVCCFAGRMLLWLYLHLQGRVLIRVSIPLFLAEVLFLGGRILASSGLILRKREIAVTGGTFVVLAFLLFGFLARYVPFTMEACAEYDRMQEPYRELYAALSEEEDFAFLDVYSTVADTEKIFGMPKDDLSKRELAGGWICRSPLYEAKLENNGHTNAGDALRYERALWVCRTSSDMKTVLKALSESDYRAEVITIREVGDFSVCRITTAIPD
jgi:hypothetical protein